MQLAVDTGSFTGGGLGPPNLFKICQPWLFERGKKGMFWWGQVLGEHPTQSIGGTKRMFWRGKVLRETNIPPDPGDKCESCEESDNRPSLFNSPKIGIFALIWWILKLDCLLFLFLLCLCTYFWSEDLPCKNPKGEETQQRAANNSKYGQGSLHKISHEGA